jgi:hypothetical protein
MPYSIWTRRGSPPIASDSWEIVIDEKSGTVTFPKTPSRGSQTFVVNLDQLMGYRTDGLVENRRVELLDSRGQTSFVGAYSRGPETVVSVGGIKFFEFTGTSGERLSLFAKDCVVSIGDPQTSAP